MTAMVAAHSDETMGKVATFQEFFYNLSNNGPPESILSFITLIVYLYKLLKVISYALIKRALFMRARTIRALLLFVLAGTIEWKSESTPPQLIATQEALREAVTASFRSNLSPEALVTVASDPLGRDYPRRPYSPLQEPAHWCR